MFKARLNEPIKPGEDVIILARGGTEAEHRQSAQARSFS